MTHVIPAFAAVILLAQGSSPTTPVQTVQPPATVQRPAPPKTYNEAADAKQAIANAIKRAATDDIRVLINWGANDDPLCQRFVAAQKAPNISPTFFADEYVPVYVNVGNLDKNIELAESYGVKLTRGNLPALTILDVKGKVVAHATARDFLGSTPDTISSPAIAAFYTKHQAPAPNDTENFNNAVKQAKKDGKIVFVWFSAPW